MDDDKLTNIVSSLLDGVHGISKSETIIGEPQKAGDTVIIPVHRLKLAFGAGAADAGAHSTRVGGDSGLHAVGGAAELDPVAAIAVTSDGHPHFLTVDSDATSTWAALLEEVPELMSKLAHALGERVAAKLMPELETSDAKALPKSGTSE
jgi:uncharacterized spore protein YtfJ